MTQALGDAAARAAIRGDLDTTLVVEAAAGTGKTTELVHRIVALVARGERLARMAAVTFTDKAAGEMKLRLRRALEDARQQALAAQQAGEPHVGQRVQHLEQALSELEVARIGTIHAFCADLLRERPIEADVDPSFEMASEDQVSALLERAFDDWFTRTLVAPPHALTRLLRRGGFDDDQGASGMLRSAAMALVDDRDFDAPWPPPPSFDRERAIDELVDALLALEQQSFSADRLSRRSWRRLVESPSAAVLVEQDEASAELHGAVVLLWRRGGRTARIYSIATATAMRGRGIGQQLLTHAESIARDHGRSRMLAEVRTDNGPSLRLFARCGYREFGRYPAYYEDGTDAVRLERELSPPTPPLPPAPPLRPARPPRARKP